MLDVLFCLNRRSLPRKKGGEARPNFGLQEAGVDVRDMTRCYSGLHFMNTDELDAALKETHEVSEARSHVKSTVEGVAI